MNYFFHALERNKGDSFMQWGLLPIKGKYFLPWRNIFEDRNSHLTIMFKKNNSKISLCKCIRCYCFEISEVLLKFSWNIAARSVIIAPPLRPRVCLKEPFATQFSDHFNVWSRQLPSLRCILSPNKPPHLSFLSNFFFPVSIASGSLKI